MEFQRLCKHCGGDIVGRRSDARYCSEKCQLAAKRRRRYVKKERRRRDHVKRFCVVCGAEFLSRRFSQIYCGPKCRTHALNARRIDRQRKTDGEPRVSPEMIQRRAAAIRARWDERQQRQRIRGKRIE